ncbi:hypothetical protein ACHWQZ_G010230 [Mnemiopsis leidyi]
MHEDSSTDCVLLVEASNAINSLNRAIAVHQYLKSIYGTPSKMFINGTNKHILSAEGATQGCNLAMGFYGVGIMELIYILKQQVPECKVSWYADDSAGARKNESMVGALKHYGPRIGYFPQPGKTCLIIKDPNKLEYFKQLFPGVVVTAEGHRYLSSFIGAKAATELYVKEKVNDWVADINDISTAAASKPVPIVLPQNIVPHIIFPTYLAPATLAQTLTLTVTLTKFSVVDQDVSGAKSLG